LLVTRENSHLITSTAEFLWCNLFTQLCVSLISAKKLVTGSMVVLSTETRLVSRRLREVGYVRPRWL